jgi:hypothetical protein
VEDISDDDMRAMLGDARTYTIAILRPGPERHSEGSAPIIWEHGRRNFQLRAAGKLIAMPVGDGSDVAGVGIFNATPDEVADILADDPAIAAGVLTYELHACRGFPGDALWA